MTDRMGDPPSTPSPRVRTALVGVVVAGAVLIAGIGFTGSYAAVRELADDKGFGDFAAVFPIGIDAGIVVLLALDLLLTWQRMPLPLLRHTAWLLTGATIAFNGATAWPDPLGVGMHAVIPVLFVVAIEAARHAIGRLADIAADRYMESVRWARWLLAFPSTFRLWRCMKLWEFRSYEDAVRLEQDRLVYRARLRARYGRQWRRTAPVEALLPLKLARYGVPLPLLAQAPVTDVAVEQEETHNSAPEPAPTPVPELEAAPEHDRPHAPVRPTPKKTPNTTRRNRNNGRSKGSLEDHVRSARKWLTENPSISGAEIGRRLGLGDRYGLTIRGHAAAELASATAGAGPAHPNPKEQP